MPLQRKTSKPNVLLKLADGNLAAECCCKENFLYVPCSEVPTPTPAAKTCQYVWKAIYDCDLEMFTGSFPISRTCVDTCTPTDWTYWQQVARECWYLKTTCQFVCTSDGQCQDDVPTPPDMHIGPFSCACAPS